MGLGFKRNGVTIGVSHQSPWKKPVLSIQYDGKNVFHKVASFNDDKAADHFIDAMKQFLAVQFKEGEE